MDVNKILWRKLQNHYPKWIQFHESNIACLDILAWFFAVSFYQDHRRTRWRYFRHWVLRILPSQISCLRLLRFYHKRIFPRGSSLVGDSSHCLSLSFETSIFALPLIFKLCNIIVFIICSQFGTESKLSFAPFCISSRTISPIWQYLATFNRWIIIHFLTVKSM